MYCSTCLKNCIHYSVLLIFEVKIHLCIVPILALRIVSTIVWILYILQLHHYFLVLESRTCSWIFATRFADVKWSEKRMSFFFSKKNYYYEIESTSLKKNIYLFSTFCNYTCIYIIYLEDKFFSQPIIP